MPYKYTKLFILILGNIGLAFPSCNESIRLNKTVSYLFKDSRSASDTLYGNDTTGSLLVHRINNFPKFIFPVQINKRCGSKATVSYLKYIDSSGAMTDYSIEERFSDYETGVLLAGVEYSKATLFFASDTAKGYSWAIARKTPKDSIFTFGSYYSIRIIGHSPGSQVLSLNQTYYSPDLFIDVDSSTIHQVFELRKSNALKDATSKNPNLLIDASIQYVIVRFEFKLNPVISVSLKNNALSHSIRFQNNSIQLRRHFLKCLLGRECSL